MNIKHHEFADGKLTALVESGKNNYSVTVDSDAISELTITKGKQKKDLMWCSCMGFSTHKKCKHSGFVKSKFMSLLADACFGE